MLLLDSWTGHCPNELQQLIPQDKEVTFSMIPKKKRRASFSLYPYTTFGCRNVAQALQNITMLPLYCRLHCQYSCNIVETLPCNIAMSTFVHCFRNIAHTHCRAILQCPRLCNISGILRTHCRVQYCNVHVCAIFQEYCAHIAVQLLQCPRLYKYFRNIAHTLPCNIAMATFVQTSQQ